MHEEREHMGFAFPVKDGMVQGKITRILNGYIAMDPNGRAFNIPDEETLVATLEEAAKSLASEIISKLKNVDNAQETVSFTFMSNDPQASLVPAELNPEDQARMLAFMASLMGNANQPAQSPFTSGGPQPFNMPNFGNFGNHHHPKNNDETDTDKPLSGEDSEKIRNAAKDGGTVVIEDKHEKGKRKHY